jgi:demethylsterigmatocystin 6-O-methyltransferase
MCLPIRGQMLDFTMRRFPFIHILIDKITHTNSHSFDTYGPAIQAFQSFLAETDYQDINSNTKTPFQKGFNTELNCFQWLPQQPKLFDALQQVMTAIQSSDWMVEFDLLDKKARAIPLYQPQPVEKPFFVDVGGGYGHQCVHRREKYPNLHGRLVLQDLPQAVGQLPPIDGVKAMAQDFFEKQAIEGTSFPLSSTN